MSRRDLDTVLMWFLFSAHLAWVLHHPEVIIRAANGLTSYLAKLNAEAYKPLHQWEDDGGYVNDRMD